MPDDPRAVARALHDGPVQQLTIARMRLELLSRRHSDGELGGELAEVHDGVAAACDELREIMRALQDEPTV